MNQGWANSSQVSRKTLKENSESTTLKSDSPWSTLPEFAELKGSGFRPRHSPGWQLDKWLSMRLLDSSLECVE